MARRGQVLTRDYEHNADHAGFEEPRARKPRPKQDSANLLPGIVVRARGHHYDVRLSDQGSKQGGKSVRTCEVRGRLLQERDKDTLVAVGDHVWIVPHGRNGGLIERVEERQSVLSRQRAGVNEPAEDVILANPDQALVVFSVTNPEPHLKMLDRFLVVAEANELPAVICANKVDLTGLKRARELFGLYEEIGYTVIYVSAETNEGISELSDALTDMITVFTGPSGVGKSSLLNALDPTLNVQIGDLREVMGKGRHTTRAAQLYALPFGENTFVADTPGIRELGLYDMATLNLGFYFKEFAPYIHSCKYPSCTHDHEPDCAVRAATTAGFISPDRYDSYLRLVYGEES